MTTVNFQRGITTKLNRQELRFLFSALSDDALYFYEVS